MNLNKLILTVKNIRRTAQHHYGSTTFSILKLIYYSTLRINTFLVFENDLTKDLKEHNLDSEYHVVKPTLTELCNIRRGKDLPREFFYDKMYDIDKCYVVFKNDIIAYIHWIICDSKKSRFLTFGEKVAELNYNTTISEFRGNWLSAKMMAYISKDLQVEGYSKVAGVIHEYNYPSIKCIKKAGFTEIARIKSFGQISKKYKIP